MASILKVLGQEQAFTTPNTFAPSTVTGTTIAGWNLVRVLNTAGAVGVITINSTPSANITLAAGQEMIVKKASNTTITASASTLLGVLVAYENN